MNVGACESMNVCLCMYTHEYTQTLIKNVKYFFIFAGRRICAGESLARMKLFLFFHCDASKILV